MVLDSRFLRARFRRRQPPPLAASAGDAALGEHPRRLAGRLRPAWNFLASRALDQISHERELPRRFSAKDRRRETRTQTCVDNSAFRRRKFRQSLWLEAACPCLCLSLQPLPDRSEE